MMRGNELENVMGFVLAGSFFLNGCQVPVGKALEKLGQQLQGTDVGESLDIKTEAITPVVIGQTPEPGTIFESTLTHTFLPPKLRVTPEPSLTSTLTSTPSETSTPTNENPDIETRKTVIQTERGDVAKFNNLRLTQVIEVDALLKKFTYGIISVVNEDGELESIAALGNFDCLKDILVAKGVKMEPIQVEDGVYRVRNYQTDVTLDSVDTVRDPSILETLRRIPTFDLLQVEDLELLGDEQLICPR